MAAYAAYEMEIALTHLLRVLGISWGGGDLSTAALRAAILKFEVAVLQGSTR